MAKKDAANNMSKKLFSQQVNFMYKIRTRLMMSYFSIVVIFLLVSVAGIYLLNQTTTKFVDGMNKTDLVTNLTERSLEAEIHFKNQVLSWNRILLRGNDQEAYNTYYAEFQQADALVLESLNVLKDLHAKLGIDETLLDEVVNEHLYLRDEYSKVLAEQFDRNDPMTGQKVDAFVRGIDREFSELFAQLRADIDEYYAQHQSTFASDMEEQAINIEMQFIIGIVLGIVLSIILGFLVSRKMTKPIEKMRDILKEVGEGNLNVSIPKDILSKKNEFSTLATSLGYMIAELRNMITNASQMSMQVSNLSTSLTEISQQSAASSEEVARTIEEISTGINEQAKDTETAVKDITELGSLIEEDQNQLKLLNESVNQVTLLKDEGMHDILDLVHRTNRNLQASQEINEVIKNANESAERIAQASQMIKNIADQTNILALNAAIEASRAGEAGRGFAVLASEIRKLAEQSEQFTEEISTVIEDLKGRTEDAVATMNEMTVLVKDQTQSVNSTESKFEGIAEAIEKTRAIIEALNESGLSMHHKKDNVIRIIAQLSAISEENAAGTQEVSASIEEQTASVEQVADTSAELAKMAEEMKENIAKFKY